MLFEGEGTTFTEFVTGQRLARAYRMLTDPRLALRSITSVAFDSGFGDLSHFTRTFRRRFGDTPSDVRTEAIRHAGEPRPERVSPAPPRDAGWRSSPL